MGYLEELRNITRAQGGPPAPDSRRPEEPASGRRRRYGPLLALGAILALAGGGWLLIRQMMADSRLQDCVMSGRKNCAPVEGDPPPP